MHIIKELSEIVKKRRKEVGLIQEEFAKRMGVALTVIRKIEQNKTNLNLEKVNHVLKMFGHKLVPVSLKKLKLNDEIIQERMMSYFVISIME